MEERFIRETGACQCGQHGHISHHQHNKALLNRISRAGGHLDSVKRMIEEGRECNEIIIQLSAVISALNNAGKMIIKEHIEHCIVDAVKSGDESAIAQLNEAIDRFMK